MNLRLEHFPADAVGLADHARRALAEGELGGIPVPRSLRELPRPEFDSLDLPSRDELARALRARLAEIEHLPHVSERVQTSLSVLGQAGTLCVLTGQQPGFLSAPLYSLYKAMQACRLATDLSREWGIPVVPVFWNHADDHDVAEVHHTWLLNHNLDLQKVALAGLSSGRQPLSRIPLSEADQRLGATRALIAQMYGDSPSVEAALECFFPRDGETLPRALTRAFTQLLGHHGLVVVEPDWVRTPLSRALAKIVGMDPIRALRAGSAEDPAIDPDSAALVYHVDEGGRQPLRPGGEGFRYDGEAGSRRPAELAAEIVQEPANFSAGGLLRPLVQDLTFPTCAYIGGWGELGYHAQLGGLRDALGMSRTPFVPRVSCTLVEADVTHALERCGATLREVFEARGTYGSESDETDTPGVVRALRAEAQAASERLLALRPDLSELEPGLAVNLKRTVGQIQSLVEKIAQKGERVHRNNSGKGARQVRRLNNSLFPRETPQERILGPMPTTARHGPEWIEALYADLPAVCAEHLIVHLETPEETR